jgi:hypothetical protein
MKMITYFKSLWILQVYYKNFVLMIINLSKFKQPLKNV